MAAPDNPSSPHPDPDAVEREPVDAEVVDAKVAEPATTATRSEPTISRIDQEPVAAEGGRRRLPLAVLVTVGTIAVTLTGAALFGWLAWLLSHQPAPLRDHTGWWTWLSHVDGQALFDAARTTATILAIVGVGGAALVAYRRQDTAERAHEVTIEAQRTAMRQFRLDSDKYELDLKRHQLDTKRRIDEREREHRARFATIASQLGSDNYAVRHAGAYALASLADDWYWFGRDSERQVCVDLLCAQLRSPRLPATGVGSAGSSEDIEVRKTLIALIRSHRPLEAADEDNWKSCSLNLSGADLSGFHLEEIDLSSANLDDADLSYAVIIRSDLTEAMMTRATVTATEFNNSNMARARLYSARVEEEFEGEALPAVELGGNDLTGAFFVSAFLPDAQFPRADLTGASFGSAKLERANFQRAILAKAGFMGTRLSGADFRQADLRGAAFARGADLTEGKADLTRAKFEGALHDETTKWPDGVVPEQLRST
jgi:uncharacterized protein YjbI with pentapeptide repeats